MVRDNDDKKYGYGSLHQQDTENQSLASAIQKSPPPKAIEYDHTLQKKNQLSQKIVAVTAVVLFGLLIVYSLHEIIRDLSVETIPNIELPSFLIVLPKTDPKWKSYSQLLTSSSVVGTPGKANMIPGQVEIVKFVKPHFVFRTYGGKASQCGHWWVINPPSGDKETYFEHFAICPSWNNATDIIRCRVPVGYIAILGVGQTADCPNGSQLTPDRTNLQLNGDICSASIEIEKHLSCEYCASNSFDLAKSACSNNGPSYIDGFEFSN